MAVLASDVAAALVVDLIFAVGRRRSVRATIAIGLDRGPLGSSPRSYIPYHASEALDLKSLLLPLPAWLPCSVECSQSSIDCTLIGFGTRFVTGGSRGRCSPRPGNCIVWAAVPKNQGVRRYSLKG